MYIDQSDVAARSAADVLAKYWDGTLPIQPGVIARCMGATLLDDLNTHSGEIRRHDDGSVVIRYNPSEALVRQRFTIAHEIGHWMRGHLANSDCMHREDPVSNFFSDVRNRDEVEANQFAAQLLMPANAVQWAIEDGRWPSLDKLARLFGVSGAAMGYRMKNLGYI